jgi:DNA-binding LacI/PurR family transcriptional regulator
LADPPENTSTIEDRLDGYAQALAAANLPFDPSLVYIEHSRGDFSLVNKQPRPDIIADLATYLRSKPEITGIFATNGWLAIVAAFAVEQLGLRVPDDVSVVSIDPVPTFPLKPPAFTCGVQQGTLIGKIAVELIQKQIAGEPPRRIAVPMHIERVGSVGPPRPLPPTCVATCPSSG